MDTGAALIEACRQAPDDDAPRLIWADHVGGERGELVVVQCELARGGRPPGEVAALRQRERELLGRHGDAWAALPRFAGRYAFRRGFVEAAVVGGMSFVGESETLFEAAPLLSSLSVDGLRSYDAMQGSNVLWLIRDVLGAAGFEQIRALELRAALGGAFDIAEPLFGEAGDQLAELVVEAGAVGRLRGLGFDQCGVTSRGAHALIASGQLAGLERFRLTDDVGSDAAAALVRAMPRLARLELGVRADDFLLGALGPLAELQLVIHTWRDAAPALVRSGAAATLEALTVIGFLHTPELLGQLPRLRRLDLAGVYPIGFWTANHLPALLATPLPALRHLVCPAHVPLDQLRAIATAFGDQLEVLEVRGTTAMLSDLEPRVAGEVVFREPVPQRDLL